MRAVPHAAIAGFSAAAARKSGLGWAVRDFPHFLVPE